MTEPVSPPPMPDSKPWYRHWATTPVALAVALLVIAGLVALSQDRPAAVEAAAAPAAPAAPAPVTAEQAFLSELNTYAPNFAATDPARGAQLVNVAKNSCIYLTTVQGAQRMTPAQSVATGGGYSLAEGLLFTNEAIKHFCPEANQQSAVATTVVTAPAQDPAPTYPLSEISSGTYLVGPEVAPGQYVTEGGSICYWERAKNTEGGFGSIIANGNAQGHTTVTIKSTDKAFKVTGSCTFTKR